MTAALLVALGGAIGACARYGLASTWSARFPWAILVVNLVGSFILGVLLVEARDEILLFLGVGFCGALTTFSTFILDTFALVREGRPGIAGVNVVLSMSGSIASLALGLLVARSLLS
ncbi:MAG: fluoride efflux transporter FluC [Candidatus Nanopelagicales bacterium]